MNTPNFFIVGAPKCGTTALSYYLSTHPQIFFSKPKEPHFFATDLPGQQGVKSLKKYLNLFKYANNNTKRIGEGSVCYLYSKTALKNIKEFCPEAKIIVMLRNPVEVVQSLHQQLLHALYEDEPDFEKAWNLQHKRANGKSIPKLCRQPELLQYGNVAKFGEQIQRLYAIFDKEQVLIIQFEDFCNDTAKVYQKVLHFLELDVDGRIVFERVNDSQVLKSGALSLIARSSPLCIRNLITKLRYVNAFAFIPNTLDKILKTKKKREKIGLNFERKIQSYFEGDQKLLNVFYKNKSD
jgi:hypothetical protein